jgi:hypothetical protein
VRAQFCHVPPGRVTGSSSFAAVGGGLADEVLAECEVVAIHPLGQLAALRVAEPDAVPDAKPARRLTLQGCLHLPGALPPEGLQPGRPHRRGWREATGGRDPSPTEHDGDVVQRLADDLEGEGRGGAGAKAR